MSKRTKVIIGVVVLVLAVAGVAYALVSAQGTGPEVETALAAKKDLAVTVTASGKVEAGVSADVFPPTAGTLDEIYVSDGETVTAGEKLALLDTDALQLQVKQAKAALAGARAQLDNIGAASGGTSADIRAAQSQVNAASQSVSAAQAAASAANAAWRSAEDAYDAARAVLPSDNPTVTALSVAKKQAYAGYLQAKAGVTAAQAALDGARSALAKARNADPESQRAAAQESVRQAEAALAAAKKTLAKATLVAPIDGVVVFNAAASATGQGSVPSEGSAVAPQAAPFTIVDFSALKFTAEVDEADIDRVKVGMKVNITLDAFPGEEFTSTVTRVNPAAQQTATGGTIFEVEAELTDVAKSVLLGMKGDADIEVSSRGAVLTIPVEALFSEGGTDFVYVVANGKLKKTEITVGATTDTEVEVVQGLDDGATVALSGSTQYTDGMAVRVKK